MEDFEEIKTQEIKPRESRLASALAKAQGSIQAPTKNRVVDFLDRNGRRVFYKYADLADLIECIREPLSKNELCVSHELHSDEHDGFGMLTRLRHSSGEIISSWYPLPDPSKQDIKAQEFGSALTYARRYSLSCLLGIASEEDDDGQAAPPVKPSKASTPPVKPIAHPPDQILSDRPPQAGHVSEAQLKRLFAISHEFKWTHEQIKLYMQSMWGLSSSKELSRDQYDSLVKTIQSKDYVKAIVNQVTEKDVK